MLFADINWETAIYAVGQVIVILFGMWLADRRANKKMDVVTKDVKDAHTLINGAMGAKLGEVAEDKARIASFTGNPVDAAAADIARVLLDQHNAAEAKMKARDADQTTTEADKGKQSEIAKNA